MNMGCCESSGVLIQLVELLHTNTNNRGIDAQIGPSDTIHNDRRPDLKADCVRGSQAFYGSEWRADLLKDGKRWRYGVPPVGKMIKKDSGGGCASHFRQH